MLRAGRAAHILTLHGIDEYTVAAALHNSGANHPHPDKTKHGWWIYKAHAKKTTCTTVWLVIPSCETDTVAITVIVSRNLYTDHHRFGVVTAFCNGYEYCPSWVDASLDAAAHVGVIKEGP